MTSEPPSKKRKIEASSEDSELYFFDAQESVSTNSNRSSQSNSFQETLYISNVPVPSEVFFLLLESQQKRADLIASADKHAEIIYDLENLFLDGLARAEDNKAQPFQEFADTYLQVDLNKLGEFSCKNYRRVDCLALLSTIPRNISMSGTYTLVVFQSINLIQQSK